MGSKRKVTAEDLYSFRWVSDPAVCPVSRSIAYVCQSVSDDRENYRSHIRLLTIDGAEDRSFTNGGPLAPEGQDTAPAWSPDGNRLAFLRKSDQGRQIWIIPREGGEARQITRLPRGVNSFAWSPDGTHLLFTAKVAADPELDELTPEEENKRWASRVRVVTRSKPKADGAGLWDHRRSHLFVLDLETEQTRQITDGDYDVHEPVWSPDGRQIAFLAKIAKDPSEDIDLQLMNDLFLIDRDGGEPRRLTDTSWAISQASFSPDGKLIAFFGHDRAYEGATQTALYTISAEGGAAACLTEGFDVLLGNAAISDMRSHLRTPPPLFSADGRSIYALVSIAGSVQVCQFPLDGGGKPEALTEGAREVYQFAITKDERYLVIAVTDPLLPGDLYRVDLHTGEEVRLTAANDAFLEQIEWSSPEAFEFKASDGVTVHGWVMRPAGFEAGRRYPAILEIHGGPHAMYSHSFFHEFQLLAAQGYAVLYTNPRGSFGYGQTFVNGCRGDYGGRDYQDLMEAVDYAADHFDFIDKERLGITGGSYGGFMTNWAVGHTDRFRAAVTQRSISNWLSFYGVSDIGYFFTEGEIMGNPWEDTEKLWKHSPLAYVSNIRTPLLILHGEQDLRCPIEQAEQLYVALKRSGKETELVRFPGASHELSRSGNPGLRVERLNRIVEWFERHISKG